jgi:exoribonuclease-2
MNRKHEELLDEIAHDAMIERGLKPEFDRAVLNQLDDIHAPARDEDVRDLRDLPWCSIDNDDSRDLDQLTWAEDRGDGDTRIFIAVADVDAIVRKNTPIDKHARHNTTSVYTAARVFSMLPEKLSTDLTSLNPGEDRVAMAVEMTVHEDGSIVDGDVYRALVHNHAKLAYDRVAAWLDGEDDAPEAMRRVDGLAETLRLQDKVADRMRDLRHQNGALDLETIEARPIIRDGRVVDLRQAKRNNARMLIEDFMIAANGTTARFLARHKLPSIRRVVRSPERWDRIERIAEDLGGAAAAGARSDRARRISQAPQEARSDALPRPVAVDREGDGRGRIRRRGARRHADGPLRPRGEGLHALDGAESPLPISSRTAS